MPKFGRKFREARQAAGKTMGDVARAIGHAVSYVSDVELGRRNPFKTADIITSAALFECDAMPLIEAAAKERGAVQIETSSSRVRSVAASLARSAEHLSADDLTSIEAILNRAEKKS